MSDICRRVVLVLALFWSVALSLSACGSSAPPTPYAAGYSDGHDVGSSSANGFSCPKPDGTETPCSLSSDNAAIEADTYCQQAPDANSSQWLEGCKQGYEDGVASAPADLPPATTVPSNADDLYLSDLSADSQIPQAELLDLGNQACTGYEAGADTDQVDIEMSSGGLSYFNAPQTINQIIAAAVQHLCPGVDTSAP